MQAYLNNNDILMYSAYNESKSVIAKKFLKIIKSKIYKIMTANDRKSYLSYLGFLKTIDQPTTYHRSPTNQPTVHQSPNTDQPTTDQWEIWGPEKFEFKFDMTYDFK